ncbi:putative odorant receptor 69a isoform X1 [Drosophila takahashii]|uniref:putative odorant receptor 69a isoform X1 n=1 Tax=Drosophila takahashii TaxID=29030 RepID=UPI003898F48C
MDGKELSYRLQIDTWFPWEVQGSAFGYGTAYLCIYIPSIVGVAFAMITQNIICLFTYQLKLHFDALSDKLLTLDSRHPAANEQLIKLVDYHCRILQLGEEVNGTLNIFFLASSVFSTIAICMSSVGSAFKYANSLVAFVLYNFIICFLGTEVTFALPVLRNSNIE